jgi:hypothetical protein
LLQQLDERSWVIPFDPVAISPIPLRLVARIAISDLDEQAGALDSPPYIYLVWHPNKKQTIYIGSTKRPYAWRLYDSSHPLRRLEGRGLLSRYPLYTFWYTPLDGNPKSALEAEHALQRTLEPIYRGAHGRLLELGEAAIGVALFLCAEALGATAPEGAIAPSGIRSDEWEELDFLLIPIYVARSFGYVPYIRTQRKMAAFLRGDKRWAQSS